MYTMKAYNTEAEIIISQEVMVFPVVILLSVPNISLERIMKHKGIVMYQWRYLRTEQT
jgi:hypothetical protein